MLEKLKWLVQARTVRNMTQPEVAERAGITLQWYWNIENGVNKPSVDTAKTIAKILDLDWTRFFD